MKKLNNGLNVLEFNDLMILNNLKGKLYLYQVDSESHESCIRVQLDKVSLTIDRESHEIEIIVSVSNKDTYWDLVYYKGSPFSLIGNPDKYWIQQYLSHEYIKSTSDIEYIYIEFAYYTLYGTLYAKETIRIPKSEFKKQGNKYMFKSGNRTYFINPKCTHKRGNKLIKYRIIHG